MLNSLNEPIRWRNHSRATKRGQRTWKRNALCSNGVPCRSRIRNVISPASASSNSSLRRAKLTRAPLTTERSFAIASSSRTKPWSRTRTILSSTRSSVRSATTDATACRLSGRPDGRTGACLERMGQPDPNDVEAYERELAKITIGEQAPASRRLGIHGVVALAAWLVELPPADLHRG